MRWSIAVLFLAAVGVPPATGQSGLERLDWTGAVTSLGAAQTGKGIPKKYRPAIAKALQWIAKEQRSDGHWEATGGKYPVAMTAMAAMTLLMEGSTMQQGKYNYHIKQATDWLLSRVQTN